MEIKPGGGDAAATPARKRPYRKPEVKREKIFETQALLCGKIQITQRQCNLLRKTS
jgi:hypothetical protein